MLTILAAGTGCHPMAPAYSLDEPAWVLGSTEKVSQLIGDFDRSLQAPTLSQTGKRFGLFATDLGSSFEHRGKLYFLFGDSVGRPGDRDALGWTESRSPRTVELNFYRDKDSRWLPITVPGVSMSAFEVPTGGISVHEKMYIVVTTDWSGKDGVMGRSVMAESLDDGRSFKALYDLSVHKFINVAFWRSGGWIYLFGSGRYRKSSVYLARVRSRELADRSALQYFAGAYPRGRPQWMPHEQEAIPIFHHDVVGELSAAYCRQLKSYVMLYNSVSPRGIVMRTAPAPWGPWSVGTVIFDPWRDHGYGVFMHVPRASATGPAAGSRSAHSDGLSDPGREAEWGGEYGPYIMARYTTGSPGSCRIYFTLSTWNPYGVVIMQSDLELKSALTAEQQPLLGSGAAPASDRNRAH